MLFCQTSSMYLKIGSYCKFMPFYSFNMKKGKYLVEMTSDDVYFAKRQVDKLFEELLKVHGKLRVVLPSISSEKEKVEEPKKTEKRETPEKTAPNNENTQQKLDINSVKAEAEKNETVKSKEVSEIADSKKESVEEKAEKPLVKEEKKIEAPKKEIKDKIVEKSVEIKEEQLIEEEKEIIPEEIKEKIIIDTPQVEIDVEPEIEEADLFQNILAEKTAEIEESVEIVEEPEEFTEEPEETVAPPKKPFSFKSIIADKFKDNSQKQKSGFKTPEIKEAKQEQLILQNAVSEENEDDNIVKILEGKIKQGLPSQDNVTVISNDVSDEEISTYRRQEISAVAVEDEEITIDKVSSLNSLEELIALKKPETKLEYLLLTAFYLQTRENLFKYSLKQLNSKAMPFLGSLIDHFVVNNAVTQNLIEVVPDYNGTADVTEYCLTQEGENYLFS